MTQPLTPHEAAVAGRHQVRHQVGEPEHVRLDKIGDELVLILGASPFPGSNSCACDFCRMRFAMAWITATYRRIGLGRDTAAWIGDPSSHGDLDL